MEETFARLHADRIDEKRQHQRYFTPSPSDAEQQIPGEHAESHWTRHAVPQDGDLLDVFRDVPSGRGAGREKYDVACADATFFALLVSDEGLAVEDDESFVLVVVPGEA